MAMDSSSIGPRARPRSSDAVTRMFAVAVGLTRSSESAVATLVATGPVPAGSQNRTTADPHLTVGPAVVLPAGGGCGI